MKWYINCNIKSLKFKTVLSFLIDFYNIGTIKLVFISCTL